GARARDSPSAWARLTPLARPAPFSHRPAAFRPGTPRFSHKPPPLLHRRSQIFGGNCRRGAYGHTDTHANHHHQFLHYPSPLIVGSPSRPATSSVHSLDRASYGW